MILVYICLALSIVILILACVIAWAVFDNRRMLKEVAPLRAELAEATATATHLVESIDTTAEWVAQYKHVLSNNVNLNKQISQLTQSNSVLHGQTVELTDMLQNVNAVVKAQWTALERRDRAIGDLVPLVDQLTKALDERDTGGSTLMRRTMPTGVYARALALDLPGELSKPELALPFAFQDWTYAGWRERIVWDFARGKVCLHDDAPEEMQDLFARALERMGNGCARLRAVEWGKKCEPDKTEVTP